MRLPELEDMLAQADSKATATAQAQRRSVLLGRFMPRP
jgi:hypothetical protein